MFPVEGYSNEEQVDQSETTSQQSAQRQNDLCCLPFVPFEGYSACAKAASPCCAAALTTGQYNPLFLKGFTA